MKAQIILFAIQVLAFSFCSLAQTNVGIGTNTPNLSAALDVTSTNKGLLIPRMTASARTSIVTPATGLMVYQTDAPEGLYIFNSTQGWLNASTLNETFWKNGTDANDITLSDNSKNVGIGLSDPDYRLAISGSFYSGGSLYPQGNIGVGYNNTESIPYGLTVKDNGIGIYNTIDLHTWRMSYNSTGNFLQIGNFGDGQSIVNRMVIRNNGQVGIGNTNPLYQLDVTGTFRSTGSITSSDGSLYINGNGYLDDNKGIVRASTADLGNLRIHKQNYQVHAIISPHEVSPEFTVAWPSGIFSITPSVFAANDTFTDSDGIPATPQTSNAHRVIVKFYDCNTNSCKARLMNTDNNSVNYIVRFDVVMIGR